MKLNLIALILSMATTQFSLQTAFADQCVHDLNGPTYFKLKLQKKYDNEISYLVMTPSTAKSPKEMKAGATKWNFKFYAFGSAGPNDTALRLVDQTRLFDVLSETVGTTNRYLSDYRQLQITLPTEGTVPGTVKLRRKDQPNTLSVYEIIVTGKSWDDVTGNDGAE